MKDKEIIALVRLLEDDNDEVSGLVKQKLLEKGPDAIPDLEEAWENTMNKEIQEKIESLIHQIQFDNVKSELREWVDNDGSDLLFGAYLVARYQFPELQYSEIEGKIEIMYRDAWLEMHDNLTALEKIRVLNHVMFAMNKYSGNVSNFYSPRNSYINQVLETKKGNPISLAVVYSAVARKLDLPVFGVNLPLNYLLAYQDPTYEDDPDGIMFYVNPFNKGSISSRKELEFFLAEQKFEIRDEYLIPCSNIVTLQRILRNLYFSYEKLGYEDKIIEINQLIEIVERK